MIRILFAGTAKNWSDFEAPLRAGFAAKGVEIDLATEQPPAETDYIVYAPNPNFGNFAPYTRVKLVQSLWAGVEQIVIDPTLTQPLARMSDPGMAEGMSEYVVGHVMRHHLGMDRHIVNRNRAWEPEAPPLARDRSVLMLGLGELGRACAAALVGLNFRVLGWSRSQRDVPGVTCFAGTQGISQALGQAQIVVNLLPQTVETENLLDAERLALLPQGAVLINPGRGTAVDDAALLDALDTGQVAHATLDVFRVEPLPQDHAFWAHPRVTVTPHIAAETRVSTACTVVIENILRVEAGKTARFLVDRNAGY